MQVRTPWYVWCAARGHGLREQQRGIADEIDSLREAMAKEKERANSADVECIHLTGWSCLLSTSLSLPALFLYHFPDTHPLSLSLSLSLALSLSHAHTHMGCLMTTCLGCVSATCRWVRLTKRQQPLCFAPRRLLTDLGAPLGCTYNMCVCVYVAVGVGVGFGVGVGVGVHAPLGCRYDAVAGGG